ncbi:MAG TPA: amidohydrolase family protein [Nocardioidaceae bacterium]|nr:amidohydrolase family protein [Nocardioidaceae bacterium]
MAVVDGRVERIGDGPVGTSAWLSPGLVDLQVNGFGGLDVNGSDVTADSIVELTRRLGLAGTTTFVPTVITASEADIVRSLQAVRDARRLDPLTALAVPYVHVEGPHLSPQEGARGVHPVEHIRPPDLDELSRWQQASDGLVGMVTLSPHHPEARDYTAAASAAGVRIAIGHTDAEPDQIRAVVDAGAVLSTHLGNGARATLPRHPNHLWAQLADDRLTAGFIADGHHLGAEVLTAMTRAKGLSRSLLVSDSVALAGLPAGSYEAAVGGNVELSEDGRLAYVGTPYLAGAAQSLADGVAKATVLARLTLGEAVALATTSPSRFVNGRGRVVPGESANLVVFDWAPGDPTLTLRQVVQGGLAVQP